MQAEPPRTRPTVLVVDDDQAIAELVQALLTAAGYDVSCVPQVEREPILAAVARLEPDCVLLDSSAGVEYGAYWEVAAELAKRGHAIPVVMFTAHTLASREANAGASIRSQAAEFSGVVAKPFDIDVLRVAVAKAVSKSTPLDQAATDLARTRGLAEELQQAGAANIAASTQREWITARVPSGALVQLYWWADEGVYYVGRYSDR